MRPKTGRPHVYFDTSAVNWLLDNDGTSLQSIGGRYLPVVNEYVAVELGATQDPARRRALFELLAGLLGKEDKLLARPTAIIAELTRQFYREGWNARVNIAESSSNFIWKYIEHPDEAAEEEFQSRCQHEKEAIEERFLELVRDAFNFKKHFFGDSKNNNKLPTPTWEEQFALLQADMNRLVPVIVQPFVNIVEEELRNDASFGRYSNWDESSLAMKRKALQEEWFKIPLLCSYAACWLRFLYEVLKALEQPKPSAKWRKMATDLLQGIHLAQPGVDWLVSNDGGQRKLLHDVACAIPRLCPGIAVAKVIDPEELINLGS